MASGAICGLVRAGRLGHGVSKRLGSKLVRILVVGGYGLIGSAVTGELLGRGAEVIGAGRHPRLGASSEPRANWIHLDLAAPASIQALTETLRGVDAVVNAAGALQDTGPDRLDAVHDNGLRTLLEVCREAGVARFIQISAPGASPDSSTAFLRTKARGDAAVKESGLGYAILRPGLVLGEQSHGGSTLLRALACLPLIQPVAHGDARVHTVALNDVARETAAWALGERPCPVDVDLVADDPVALADLVASLRRRLGYEQVRIVRMPGWTAALAGRLGDLAGLSGWRSPLRSTAMTVMAGGVAGDPAPLRAITGRSLRGLDETLREIRALAQERNYARVFWLRPLIILTLSAFWLATGLLGLLHLDAAALVLIAAGLEAGTARLFVLAGSLVDIALGAGVLVRRTHGLALSGMIAVTLGYLGAATLIAPELWADPLGPLVKAVPALVLALTALSLRERR